VFLANGLRAIPTLLLLFIAGIVLGSIHEICRIEVLFFAFLSFFVDLILGDTFFFLALKESPLSIACPIPYSFSLFAAVFSTPFLKESITAYLLTSIAILVLGVYLIYRGSSKIDPKVRGVLYNLQSSFRVQV